MAAERSSGTWHRGRGSDRDPGNRFERLRLDDERDADAAEPASAPHTQVIEDHSRSILSRNSSPDIPFAVGLNPYRGCEHGCSYCYARPYHEYLGYSPGLDFESKIVIKPQAAALLRDALSAPDWQPQAIGMSGVTDCYQPLERRYELTRSCLQVLAEFRNPVSLITKNRLVTRDIDHLQTLAASNAVSVTLSITSLQPELSRVLEPRASMPQARLEAITALADAGIPVGVNVAPIIPGLTDHEMPAILQAAAQAGASSASYTVIRLPYAVEELFTAWLEEHAPSKRDKVLGYLQDLRGDDVHGTDFSTRMRGGGIMARHIADLFALQRRRHGLAEHGPRLATDDFRSPHGEQQTLF